MRLLYPEAKETKLLPNIIKSDEVTNKTPFLIQSTKTVNMVQRANRESLLSTGAKTQESSAAGVDAEQVLVEAQKLAEKIVSQARVDAGVVLQKASQEAENIKEQAKKDGYAQGHEQGERHGQEEGYRAGYQQGLEEGTAAVRQEMAEKIGQAVKQSEKTLLQAEKERAQIIVGADRQIIELALAVAGKVLAREMEENPLIILPIVKEALEKVRDQAQLVVRVNPAHYSLLLEAKNDLQRMVGGQQTITILSDQSLGEADCMVETGNGAVDARMETQLGALRQRLEELVSG